ncbi:cysteine dioxygenase [Niveispirillum sp. BGYR6]|uniref:cysteine dioxygenase family protein n=1 Tax=Niveispirillum sp. BGYR6 TaxID=2971249 RepID=UPI0022B9D1D1|nr:cysteine dioxygenase [Niveispirillum sp. BGYR6]MDG5496130.1 cysteine dioxygenase [Niveispirillum sp. BGYR6]
MSQQPPIPKRLARFVTDLTRLLETPRPEAALLDAAAPLLGDLVAQDDWLPEAYTVPDPERYRQFLLYRDPQARFSVVSFVWGPNQGTPVHDHTVWGLVGVLRGSEISQGFAPGPAGPLVTKGLPHRLKPGDVEKLSPLEGDIHRVINAEADRTSISIHVYGADIGAVRRWTYPGDGQPRKPFISGYSNNDLTPPFTLSSHRPLELAR